GFLFHVPQVREFFSQARNHLYRRSDSFSAACGLNKQRPFCGSSKGGIITPEIVGRLRLRWRNRNESVWAQILGLSKVLESGLDVRALHSEDERRGLSPGCFGENLHPAHPLVLVQ